MQFLTSIVCYLGRSPDHPSLQPPVSGSTRHWCHFPGACGQDRASGEEADKTVEARNDGSPLSGVGARLCETHGRNESARGDSLIGAMVSHGHERGWTCQDACKLPIDEMHRANNIITLRTDGRCRCKMARVRRARARGTYFLHPILSSPTVTMPSS